MSPNIRALIRFGSGCWTAGSTFYATDTEAQATCRTTLTPKDTPTTLTTTHSPVQTMIPRGVYHGLTSSTASVSPPDSPSSYFAPDVMSSPNGSTTSSAGRASRVLPAPLSLPAIPIPAPRARPEGILPLIVTNPDLNEHGLVDINISGPLSPASAVTFIAAHGAGLSRTSFHRPG